MSTLPIPRPALQAVCPSPDVCLTLTVGGWDYDLAPILDADPSVAVRAWELRKLPLEPNDPTPIYHVFQAPAGWSSCDCPDATFRKRECKHLFALQRLGLIDRPQPVRCDRERVAWVESHDHDRPGMDDR